MRFGARIWIRLSEMRIRRLSRRQVYSVVDPDNRGRDKLENLSFFVENFALYGPVPELFRGGIRIRKE